MEWLLLWMVLSAISLEGITFFVSEDNESYHKEFIVVIKTLCAKYDIQAGLVMGVSLYGIMLILSPVVAYLLLSMED